MNQNEHFSKEDIEKMEPIRRIHFMNSINGFKSANLIGTKDADGNTNLAIFSSVIHLGSSPALLGFVLLPDNDARHTFDNIKETGYYTVNHVHRSITEKAHFTSAKFEKELSEFETCGLNEEYRDGFDAPYVQECHIKIGMKLEKVLDIAINGTKLVIGSIQHVYTPSGITQEDGSLSLHIAGSVAITGLDSYYKGDMLAKYPYARASEAPDFNEEEKRPDQVVFDEKSGTYNASLLPYATDQGAPSIVPTDLTLWKKSGASKISHHLKARYDEIRVQFEEMKTLYSWNEMVYQAKFSFEPILGETYHLYKDSKAELFLSLIPPDTWKREHMGSFRLNADQIWERLDDKN